MNIIITGISKGLGLVTARVLLAEGCSLFGISREMTEDLRQLSINYPDRLQWRSFDLQHPENIKEMIFKNWIGSQTPIHGLVNNAGIAYDDLLTNMSYQPLDSMFRINVFSAMILTKYTIRQMLLHEASGSIVHVSSVSAHYGTKGLSMYAATKGALEAFSKNTAREWGERGIRSNCIVAGLIETNMNRKLSEEQKARIIQRTSLKKPVDANSAAAIISFLLSEKAASITGQNVFVDCGAI